VNGSTQPMKSDEIYNPSLIQHCALINLNFFVLGKAIASPFPKQKTGFYSIHDPKDVE
jgi:hypothetical protein